MKSPDLNPPNSHDAVVLLLPWFANGSLDGEESALVRAHLEVCPECRDDLAMLNSLAEAVRSEPAPGLPADSPARVRVHRPMLAKSARTADRHSRPARRRSSWMIPAAAAMALLAVLPFVHRFFVETPTAGFHTLANPPASPRPAGDLRVVFARDLQPGRIEALLRKVDGRIVEGPNAVGAYTVRLGATGSKMDAGEALAQLRGREGVLLAEPATRTD